MKFVLLVEGSTERQAAAPFIKRWLDGEKLKAPVAVQAIDLGGLSKFRKEFAKRAEAFLSSPESAKIIGVVGLLDLYGPDYPGHCRTVDARYSWAKKDFEDEVGDARFRMFFAVHELEAWLLSDLSIFPVEVRKALPRKTARPETVNFDEPPSKLIDRLYRQKSSGRHYKKTVDGKRLFDRLDPKLAAAKCPRLGAMLNEMLAMARKAGL